MSTKKTPDILRHLRNAYGRLRIRTKILVSYALLLLALVLSLGVAALWQMSELVNDRFLATVSASVRQLATHISYRMRIVGNGTEMLSWDNDLRRILSYDRESYPLSSQIDDIRVARDILLSIRLNEDVAAVRLYLRNPGLLAQERETFYPLRDIEGLQWLDAVESSGGRAVWLEPGGDPRAGGSAVTFVRCIHDSGGAGECLGILAVDIEASVMNNVLRQSGLLREARALVLRDARDSAIAVVGHPPGSAAEASHIVLSEKLSFPEWTLRAYIPRSTILGERRRLVVSFVGILLAATVVAMILTLSISRRISERITGLADAVSDPNAAAVGERFDDEITELQRFLTDLVFQNRELVREVFEEQMAEKEATLRALQTQINPHFLYNTLDTINWMALRKNDQEISTVVSQLARYYRLSIGQSTNIVTIREEIEHVRAYLGIYEARYEGAIRTEFDVEQEVLEYKTVKLILQPLAENAVVHGISKTERQSGLVTIAARLSDGAVEISVSDDGCGLTADALEEIMADEQAGFALRNIDERIKLYCGAEYGLRFDFSVDVGTRAIVRLARNT